jgi:predicted type IV restriction endonuclease
MDLVDKLRELASRLPRQLDYIQTEEATKSALIMPFRYVSRTLRQFREKV